MKITEVKKMEELLDRKPELREDKYKAIAQTIYSRLPEQLRTTEVINVLMLLTDPKHKSLPALETLSRSWRKVLEMHPEWVTAEHAKRRKMQEIETVQNLGGISKHSITQSDRKLPR